jgi:2-iminobutanoate/2-iminopropanoate deaminase
MKPQPVFTDKAPKPIGPYSQAMLAGDLLFLSGQIALDPVSGEMVGTTVEEQARRALENMNAVLVAQKCDFGSLVKVTIFLISMADFTVVNRVCQEVLGQAKPARSVVEVARLPRGALIEIEGVAQR